MPQSRPQETNVALFWWNPAKLFFCFTNDFFFKRFGRELTECQNKTAELVQVST
jgi:hypothetical protein